MATDREDRWNDDDRDDREDRGGRRRRDDGADPEIGRSKVKGPAVGLIITGVLGLLIAIANFAQHSGIDAQFEEQFKQIENSPAPADQKKAQKDMMIQIRDGMKAVGLPMYGLQVLTGLVILIGGVKLLKPSSPGLAKFASVMAMIPCLTGCCLVGLPVGIWALVVLANPDVKAAFAANASGGRGRDADDDLDR